MGGTLGVTMIYMAHLKYADKQTLSDSNVARETVSRDRRRGGWANSSKVAGQRYTGLTEANVAPVFEEIGAAYKAMSQGFGQHRRLRKSYVVPQYQSYGYFRIPTRWIGKF